MRKQIKQTLLVLIPVFVIMQLFAQVKPKPKVRAAISPQLAEFKRITTKANVIFTVPPGFREIEALDNEDFTFDYAMDLPGRGFEVWYMVRSQKENWASYERVLGDEELRVANPDSIYMNVGKAHAIAFTGERDLFIKTLPPSVLKRYNADAGKSYLLSLLDMPETKRYQYALLIALQKYHTGTVLMVCFTNQKTPEFYKNVERAGRSLKFNP